MTTKALRRILKLRRQGSDFAQTETIEQLEARLAAYAELTRERAMRPVDAVVPTNVTVLAGPRRRVKVAA
jgi:hypothetical protein